MRRLVVAIVGLTACGRLGFDGQPDDGPPCIAAVEVASLVAGEDFTCARLADGTLRCWGAGDHGQLGDDAFTTRLLPIQPAGLGAVEVVSASLHHTCAVAGGGVSCWGRNDAGQLGLGDRASRGVATPVAGLPADVVGVTAGGLSSCAWTASGQLWCWGQENGTMAGPLTARRVTGVPAGVTSARQGTSGARGSAAHGCAIAGGTTWCWGENNSGQLGDGTTVKSPTPVQVVSSETFVELALGNSYTCGRTAAGAVWCWGHDSDGQLGDGMSMDALVPVPVEVTDVVALAANAQTTCALRAGGDVMCWGDNDEGQLGRTGDDALVPERIDVAPARAIAVGLDHSCALAIDGVVRCWGGDRAGQRTGSLDPQVAIVEGVIGASGIDAGGDVTCVRYPAGTVQCWGANQFGQLGDGTVVDRSSPVDVLLTRAATDISVGAAHACARYSDAVTCWGDNESGNVALPAGGFFTSPSDVGGIGITAATVTAGGSFTCATPSAGIPWCWGANYEGQLGRTSPGSVEPPAASRFPAVLRSSAGGKHTCALTGGGGLFCSGRDNEGQIGRSDAMNDVYDPLEVLLAPMVTAFAAGDSHSCATSASLDRTWCWGNNAIGQLGDGTDTSRLDPTQIAVSGIAELVADRQHTCARDGANRVWCWGSNASGQLGDGTLASSRSPVVATQLAGSVALAAGRSHTCGLQADGSVRCVGANHAGQLGRGGVISGPAPLTSNLTCP